MKEKIIQFLIANGYSKVNDYESEYQGFFKNNKLMQVDINNNEIVLLADEGDICHIPLNYFALIGMLIHYRQIAIDFKNIL